MLQKKKKKIRGILLRLELSVTEARSVHEGETSSNFGGTKDPSESDSLTSKLHERLIIKNCAKYRNL